MALGIGEAVLAAVSILALAAIVIFVTWIMHKERLARPHQKPNTIRLGIFLVLVLIFLFYSAEFFGALPDGWNKDHIFIHAFLVLAIISLYIATLIKHRFISTERSIEIVTDTALNAYHWRKLLSKQDVDMLAYYKIEENKLSDIRGVVAHIVLELTKDGQALKRLYGGVNLQGGSLVEVDPYATEMKIDELRKLEPVSGIAMMQNLGTEK